ncbi:unnamed protein product [Malus baccata var. baccata]
MTINDLVEVKQYEHESTDDFMMRFKKTRMRCQFPELVIAATRYEKLLLEKQQVKHTSKISPFYKNKATIHHVEVGEIKLEQEDDHDREEIEVCAAKMTTHFKPLTVKGLVQPIKDQKIVMNDGGFVPMKPPKYQSYSFDLAKAPEIYEELVRARVIVPDSTKKMPKPEELRGKKYCKLHYTFNHSITNCVQFRDWVQDLIVKGKLLLDKPQASMMVDTNPFPEAPINAIHLV